MLKCAPISKLSACAISHNLFVLHLTSGSNVIKIVRCVKIVESLLSSSFNVTSLRHSSNLNNSNKSEDLNRPINVIDFDCSDHQHIAQHREHEVEVPLRQAIDFLPPDLISIDPTRCAQSMNAQSMDTQSDGDQLVEIQSPDTRPVACRTRRQVNLNLIRLVPCLTTTHNSCFHQRTKKPSALNKSNFE